MSGCSALRRSGRFMVMVSRPLSRLCRTISFALMSVVLVMVGYDDLITPSLLHQWAARRLKRLERLVAGDGCKQLVDVPATLRFRRLLDLEQIHVMHHAAVLTD